MLTLKRETFRILNYTDIPKHIVEEAEWLENHPSNVYLEYIVEKEEEEDVLNSWILANVEGVSPGQSILVHTDY